MHLGIFAKTFERPTLEETLDVVVYLSLTSVQFNMSCVDLPTLPDRIDENQCRWIAQSLRERGIAMAAISGTFNLCDPDEARLDDNLRRLDVLAAACRWLDTRIITLCTGTLDPNDMWKHDPDNVRRSAWETLLKSVRAAIRIADRHEVTLAFEPEVNNVVSSAMRARKLLDEVGSPWLKVVIDPTNLFRPGEVRPLAELLGEAFDWLGPDVVLAHAKPPRWGEQPHVIEWLSTFLGQRYRENYSHVTRRPGVSKRLDRRAAQLDDRMRLKAFFGQYATALEQIGYNGAVIIHGVEEAHAESLVALVRREMKSL